MDSKCDVMVNGFWGFEIKNDEVMGEAIA